MSNRKEYILPNGKKAVFEYDVYGVGKVTLECMDELMAMIADRPQGEWMWHEDEDICNCSECKFEIDATGCIEPVEYVGVFRYCPNCGSRMKGADDE